MEAHRIRDDSLSHGSSLQVLLDTSFLLTMLNQHRDLEQEISDVVSGPITLCTLDRVMFELEHLARTKSSKSGGLAEASLGLLKKRNYSVLESTDGPSDVDTTLIAFALAEKKPVAVATVDRDLREALVAYGIPTIYPKARSGLVLLRGRSLFYLNKRVRA